MPQILDAVNRRNEDLFYAANELMFVDDLFRKFPIGDIGDHKLYFVLFPSQKLEVWPMISLSLAGCRTLYIEDDRRSPIYIFGRDKSAGLDQNFVTPVAQLGDKRKDILLSQRLAARDLDQLAAKFVEPCKNLLKRYSLAAIECIVTVAPDAPHRTTRQPHKRARPPGV